MSDDAPDPGIPANRYSAEGAEPAEDSTPTMGRAWKAAAGIAVVCALAAAGVLAWLLFAGSDGPADDVRACVKTAHDFAKTTTAAETCPPAGAKQMDGLVEKTTSGGFSIRLIEGGRMTRSIKLHVREPDRAYIDVAHAQTHAALGQPVRVYTEKIDGVESVVYMEDAPLLG